MREKSHPIPHIYTPEDLAGALRANPFPVKQWEAARTSRIPNDALAPVVAAMREASFHLLPRALMGPETMNKRTLYDLVARGRTGVSLVEGLEPCAQAQRDDYRFPALAMALSHKEQDPFFVRPGFVVANDKKYFWDGEHYFALNDAQLTVFTYWKLA